jgi:hypothetical protein
MMKHSGIYLVALTSNLDNNININSMVLWDVTSCRLVDDYQYSRGACCLNLRDVNDRAVI